MKKKIIFLCFSLLVLLSIPTFSQGPGEPYNPMTANGAEGIENGNYIIWKNPSETIYNEVYCNDDSLLVATLNPSVKILDGYPNIVYFQFEFNFTYLEHFKKFYWRVVEHNTQNFTVGPIWSFRTIVDNQDYFIENFNDLNLWTVIGPNGIDNWYLGYLGLAGGQAPELEFSWTPSFTGTSYIRLNKVLAGGSGTMMIFKHMLDWYADIVTIGLAYSTNNGIDWISKWEINAASNVGPEQVYVNFDTIDEFFNLAFYYSGNSFNIDYWYIDDLVRDYALSSYDPPGFLQVAEDTINQKVILNWTPGYSPGPLNYKIKRKIGMPTDTSSFYTIGYTCNALLSYEDYDVQPNTNYTYRVHTVLPCPNNYYTSIGGNYATAYVPNIVPVELQSFTAEVIGSYIQLLWSTATETNNSGFEILRCTQNDNGGWEKIGFVPGFGTTTEVHHYSFVDESLQPGNYQYRLKQIDFDGSFEYSNTIEVKVNAPTKFSLEQNYPNPFNPITKIKFTIPASLNPSKGGTFVTLKVYYILGKAVATLVNEELTTGVYETEFDGTGLPSGIYFYQLKAGSFIETKKMVLLK